MDKNCRPHSPSGGPSYLGMSWSQNRIPGYPRLAVYKATMSGELVASFSPVPGETDVHSELNDVGFFTNQIRFGFV